MLKNGERLFAEWSNGVWMNSFSQSPEDFLNTLVDMVRLFGTPTLMEIRTEGDWMRGCPVPAEPAGSVRCYCDVCDVFVHPGEGCSCGKFSSY